MIDPSALSKAGLVAGLATARKVRSGLDRTGQVLAVATGTLAASLSQLNNFNVDPLLISRIVSATSNHGVTAADALSKLPGELEQYGTAAVDAFLSGGDTLGKHWSHIQSQLNAPNLAADPSNAIWEDGTKNVSRGGTDMSWIEKGHASIDNHLDGLIAAAQTPEFWHRTLGNALEAGAYAAAVAAIDQLLIHRDELINGSIQARKDRLVQILQTSGLMAAGALPVSVFMAIALMLVPGLAVAVAPLGMIGTAGLGLRLISSAVRHPSRQEQEAVLQLQSLLREKIYTLRQDKEGNCLITEKTSGLA